MGKRSKRVAFIPVRGGSKSIPGKNIKKIAGKPLLYWAMEAALESGIFDDIYISTEDSDIAGIVGRHPLNNKFKVVNRSQKTATDTATTESAMIEFALQHDFESITLIQATSPLTEDKHIREAMERFEQESDADSLLSVCRQERFIWRSSGEAFYRPVNYDPLSRPRRQDFEGFLVENGCFYITTREQLLETGSRLSGNILCYELPPETYVELDEPSDWTVVEQFLNKKRNSLLAEKLKKIRLFITDVDGVLTDAGMYYSEKGDELKKFNTRDGKGLELLRKEGIEVVIITSEDTRIVSDRAKKLKIDTLYQGIKEKAATLEEILNQKNLDRSEVAYIGDDVNDLSVIREVGFSACPADAMDKIKQEVDYCCAQKGGEGCVRELSDLIVKVRSNE